MLRPSAHAVSSSTPYPTVGNDQFPPFSLDLSGARVRVGVAVPLRKPW